MTPDEHDLWFLPLGGTGEIGMNLNLYGHDGQWLMAPCIIRESHRCRWLTRSSLPTAVTGLPD